MFISPLVFTALCSQALIYFFKQLGKEYLAVWKVFYIAEVACLGKSHIFRCFFAFHVKKPLAQMSLIKINLPLVLSSSFSSRRSRVRLT